MSGNNFTVKTKDQYQKMSDKERMIAYIREHEYTSFAELEQFVFEAEGRVETYPDGTSEALIWMNKENLIIWQSRNKRLIDAYLQIEPKDEIITQSCNPFVYMTDGMLLKYPFAKKMKDYETEHWMPVTMHVAKPGEIEEIQHRDGQ